MGGIELAQEEGMVKPTGTGISAGRGKGHVTTRIPAKCRPSNRKGMMTKSRALCKEVIRETVGFAPYERRIMELLKIGTAQSVKRSLKYAKKRLGTLRRGRKKRDGMEKAIQAARRKA